MKTFHIRFNFYVLNGKLKNYKAPKITLKSYNYVNTLLDKGTYKKLLFIKNHV